jgi:2-succinyl-6-hydroxy-2,4-cyclohexadiene-1-carboxylate synthase
MGPNDPLNLVALHGFTGSGADFDVLREALKSSVQWTTPDLPGHGENLAPFAAAYTVPAMASAVATYLRTLPAGHRVLLGYSMGGRVALRCALDWPGLVDALVLIGAHPGIRDDRARRDRALLDTHRAARIRSIGAAAFSREWAQVPLIATQDRVPEPFRTSMRERRATNDPLRLSIACEVGGTGSMEPMWSRLQEVDVPTLLVTGSEDDKYRNIVADMLPLMRTARPGTVRGAGHAAHVESPQTFSILLASFLDHRARIG